MLPIFIQLDVTDDAFNADRIFRNVIGFKTLIISIKMIKTLFRERMLK